MEPSRSVKPWALLFASAFLCAGLAFLPYPGIENDEAIFASPLYPPYLSGFRIANIPVMVMDYAGCLKTWIYAVIFAVFPPSVWSLRLPVLLLGCVSIFLFTLLLARSGGTRAAWIGGALLTTDPVFLLTNDFDWGPVALQHFLLIAGLLSATEFHRTGRRRWLALASFAFGLGLWDKVLFAWLLLPVCVAAVCLWPHAIRRQASWRNVLVASAGFLAGISPLLWFNIEYQWITLRAHTAFGTAGFATKLEALHLTANGSALLGFLARGPRHGDLLEWGFLLALLILPFVWRTEARKPALFCLIVLVGAWAQMALAQGTGAAAHHVILLWPMPQLLIGAVFSRMRRAGPALALVLVASNVLVLERYWTSLRQEGPALVWTDAIDTLPKDLMRTGAERICVIDWGMFDVLEVLGRGKLPLNPNAADVLAVDPNEAQRSALESNLRDKNALWLSHMDGEEQFTGINERLDRIAERYGLRRVRAATYRDRHNREVFETFRFTSK